MERVKGYRVHVYINGIDQGTRAVDHVVPFGNFGELRFRVKGIRYRGLAESFPDECGHAVIRDPVRVSKGA